VPILPIALSFTNAQLDDGDWAVTLEWFLVSRQSEGITIEAAQRQRLLIAPLFQFTGSTPENVSGKDIELFLSSLLEQGKSPDYVKIVFKALRSFFSWCVDEDLIKDSPTRKVKPPRTPLQG